MDNFARSLLASQAATTATRTSVSFYNEGRGIHLHLKTANKVGTTATYTLSLASRFPDGTFVTIWTAVAAVTANGDANYILYPAAIAGTATEKVILAPGGMYRVVLTAATADAANNMDTLVDAWELV